MADRCGETALEIVDGHATVDALDHARVGVAEDRGDQVRGGARLAQPGGARAAQIVWTAWFDPRAVACLCEIAAHVLPGQEEQAAGALGVVERVLHEGTLFVAHQRDCAPAGAPFRAADQHAALGEFYVFASCTDDGAPFGRGRNYERDRRGAIGRELREQALQLGRREIARAWLVLGRECDRAHRRGVAAPQARTAGELQRGAQGDQLLRDGVLCSALTASDGDVAIDVAGFQRSEPEASERAVLVVLEDAGQVSALGAVERKPSAECVVDGRLRSWLRRGARRATGVG